MGLRQVAVAFANQGIPIETQEHLVSFDHLSDTVDFSWFFCDWFDLVNVNNVNIHEKLEKPHSWKSSVTWAAWKFWGLSQCFRVVPSWVEVEGSPVSVRRGLVMPWTFLFKTKHHRTTKNQKKKCVKSHCETKRASIRSRMVKASAGWGDWESFSMPYASQHWTSKSQGEQFRPIPNRDSRIQK